MLNVTKKMSRNGLLLSFLLHLLILLSISSITIFEDQKQKIPPQQFVPAYVYSQAVSAYVPPSAVAAQQKTTEQKEQSRKPISAPLTEQAKNSIATEKKSLPQHKSMMQISREVIRNQIVNASLDNASDEEPMLLIGDTSQVADPFIKLIGRALSAHFAYPKMEGSFGIRGKVIVEMILNPDGSFTDPQIIRSSDNHDFDSAALYAVNMAPKVEFAYRFIHKPRHMIVGFIFD